MYVPMRQAGMHVDHDTALKLSTVFACTRVIAETVAQLPWRVYRENANGGRDRVVSSPLENVLQRRPNPEMGAFTFRETLLAWALTWGNGYAEIVRDQAGRVAELWPIAPDRVCLKRASDGVLYYEVSNQSGAKTLLDPADVFHLHGLGFDGVEGYSVISMAARSIGLGLAADEFGASFFGNSTVVSGILKHPATLSEEAVSRLKESWKEQRQGPSRAHSPIVLEEGMTWEQLGIPPDDAQFLETRRFQVQDICRWFRVPPHKVADLERATFSNIEHQSIEFVVDTIMPWCLRLEQEADRKLFGRTTPQRMYTKLNANALLRGDAKSRSDFYSTMWNLGVLSVNEIRELEDLNPIGEDGDKRFVQLNMTTLERAGEEPEPQPQPEAERDVQFEADEEELANAADKIDRSIVRSVTRHLDHARDRQNFCDLLNNTFRHKEDQYVSAVAVAVQRTAERLGLATESAPRICRQWASLQRQRAMVAAKDAHDRNQSFFWRADAAQLALLLHEAANDRIRH